MKVKHVHLVWRPVQWKTERSLDLHQKFDSTFWLEIEVKVDQNALFRKNIFWLLTKFVWLPWIEQGAWSSYVLCVRLSQANSYIGYARIKPSLYSLLHRSGSIAMFLLLKTAILFIALIWEWARSLKSRCTQMPSIYILRKVSTSIACS